MEKRLRTIKLTGEVLDQDGLDVVQGRQPHFQLTEFDGDFRNRSNLCSCRPDENVRLVRARVRWGGDWTLTLGKGTNCVWAHLHPR